MVNLKLPFFSAFILLAVIYPFVIYPAYTQTFPISDFDPNLQRVIAFPGAEGFGKYATGGRGGQVLKVTNLNDSGPGSLRWALEEIRGPRIVIFEVSGNIKLASDLMIYGNDVTIAGQTAPGDGITLQNYPLRILNNSNIIIRYLRSRLGDLSQTENDAFEIRDSKNIIVDHCSFSWGMDETCSITYVENVTLQNSIISEGLNDSFHSKGEHGYGSLMGGQLSLYGNLWSGFRIRNPSLASSKKGDVIDLRNNVFYNWGFRPTDNGEETSANLYSNYYKPGPASKAEGGNSVEFFLWPTAANFDVYGKFYLEGNKLEGITSINTDQWKGVRLESEFNTSQYLNNLKNKDQNGNLVPFAVPNEIYSLTRTADDAFSYVLTHVGANLFRDAVDERVINETRNGISTYRGSKTGLRGIIDSQRDVGGWPTLRSLPAPLDSDQDGMPDVWETANNLNPNRSNDREYNLSPYYTDIEVYINSLVDNLTKGQYPSTPLAVSPILPAANATNISPVDISFSWTMIPNADSYQVQISKSSSFSTGNITLSNQKNLSLVYPQLDANSTYYWRVRAISNGVSGPYSSARIFQTTSLAVVPGRTQLLFPTNNMENASREPVFSWAKVPNTESYQIQVSTLSDFSTLLVNQSGLTENSFQSPRLAENQTYYWRVRGRNGTGTGSFSNVGVFKTISQSSEPDIVVAIRPSNGVVINPVNIRLDWQAVAGADSYSVQVSTSSSFSNLLVNQSGIKELYFDIANLNSNTLYYWRVRGVNRSGNGSFSKGDLSFRTGPFTQAPAQITLVNPANDSNLFSTSISFSWTKDPIAKGYTFQLSTREDFSSFVTNVSNITSTSRTVSGLQANTQYFWRVWATNEAGNSPMSEVRKVRSATYSGRPGATTLVSPSNNSLVGSVDIAFTWNNQPNSNAYRLEVSEFSNFSSLAYSKSSIPGTTWIVPSLTQNKTYFWRVRTSNPAGTGSYSEIWKFSTSSSTVILNQPTLTSPSNAALHQATTVNFSWNAVTNATGYDLQISESNTFSNIAFSLSNVNTNSGSISNLAESKTYFWRVRAKAGTANSAWSSVWNFSTKGQSEGTTLDAGLVGYWKMDEGNGSRLLDQSPNSNHLNLQNLSGTSWEAGVDGSAVGLNGNSNSFATISHNSSLSIPNAITISAWVKPNLLHRGTILYKSAGNGFEFWLDSDGQLEFRLNRSTNGSAYRVRSNFNYGSSLRKWIHVAATFDGSTCRIYINGVEDKSVTYNPFTIGTTSGNLILGALGTIQRWQGAMDEVRLYNRALSLQEINMAMQNSGPLETNSSQMAGHWKMDEGSGNLFRDDSGNANNGTIINTSGITWSTAQIGLGVDLNGFSDRFARVPHHPSLELPNALSIASWVKPNALNRGTIVSKSAGNGFELWLDIDGFIEFRLNRTNNGSTYRLRSNYNYSGDLGKWIHIAATFDGRTSKIYINGVENVSQTFAAPFGIGTSSGDLFIGAMGTVQRMNGSLDDLRIYGKAISDGEIRALVDQGTALMRVSAISIDKNQEKNQTSNENQEETSVPEVIAEIPVKPLLYPNPAEQKIHVTSLWLQDGPVRYNIYDLNGRTLLDGEASVSDHSLEIEINHLGLNAGNYLLILQDNFHRIVLRFMKK